MVFASRHLFAALAICSVGPTWIKTILIIVLSVTFFGVLFFILVRNALKRKLEILVEEEKKKKLDNLD